MSLLMRLNYKQQILFLHSYTTHRHKGYTNIRFIYESSKFKLHKSSSWLTLVPLGLLTGICYVGYRFLSRNDGEIRLASRWQMNMYRMLPLRATSRLWGRVSEMSLPSLVIRPMLRLYVWAFDCKMHEAIIEDLDQYKTFGEFFRRELKSGLRTIDEQHLLTSPADGTVLHYGRVVDGCIEQVKGVSFSLDRFLGPSLYEAEEGVDNNNILKSEYNKLQADSKYSSGLTNNQSDAKDSCCDNEVAFRGGPPTTNTVSPGNELYFCTVYLAPGDYHRFHSPARWTVDYRRHFPGDLLSVSPGVMRWIRGLFNYNERAVYYGSWSYGFFALAAIGATNVGSIRIYCDRDLVTNNPRLRSQKAYYDRPMTGIDSVSLSKGEMFGEFNLGSSLVIIFEAPTNFAFNITQGQKVKVGEPIGTTSE